MALQHACAIPAGIDVAGTSLSPAPVALSITLPEPAMLTAYWRVDGGKALATAYVGIYDGPGGPLLMTQTYAFVPSVEEEAPNYIRQAYLHLKTLPEFTGAVELL